VSICAAPYLDWWTVHAEVVQPRLHRFDLCFKIGDGPSEVPLGCPRLASILAFAVAQHAYRDRHPSYPTLEAVPLELRAQGVRGSRDRTI
jgi:DNA-binding transcriptional LysR family regulator